VSTGTHLEAGYQMVVDFDLSKFFDRVHHQRLGVDGLATKYWLYMRDD
jgi:hypothetical protein